MKAFFPLLAKKTKLVYLDSASTSQKPACVLERMKRFSSSEYANVHRGLYPLAVSASTSYEKARLTVAKFIGAQANEIIFTKGSTESMNAIATMLAPLISKDKNEIVLTEMEHHANIVPWQQLAKKQNLVIRFIPLTKTYELDYAAAKKMITQKTALVSAVHVSNTLGTVNNIDLLSKLAKSVGAFSIIDGAQSISQQKINVKKVDCDFFVFSGHKLYGPTGIGVMYGKKSVLEKLEPYQTGGNMIESVTFTESTWADIPQRFEAGTTPFVEAIGLGVAIDFVQSQKLSKIKRHVESLSAYALKRLRKIKTLSIIGPKKPSGIISFTLDGIHPHDIADELGGQGICVRGGHHCTMPLHKKLGLTGTTRISFGMYNTKEDIDVFVRELEKIIKRYSQ